GGEGGEWGAGAGLGGGAGYWAVASRVAGGVPRPAALDVEGLVVVADRGPAAAVAGLDLRWAAVTLGGRRSRAVARVPGGPPRAHAFVTGLDLEPTDSDGAGDVALGLVLPCWTLLGMLDRAIDLSRAHVLVREQFAQRLGDFQGVQFQLSDAEVERSGLEMLAGYALWSIQAGRDDALDDALALRLAAVEAAHTVFWVAHQLHGAIGFCDETPLSWVSRYSQPLRRLPLGLSATREALTPRLGPRGLARPFSEIPRAPALPAGAPPRPIAPSLTTSCAG